MEFSLPTSALSQQQCKSKPCHPPTEANLVSIKMATNVRSSYAYNVSIFNIFCVQEGIRNGVLKGTFPSLFSANYMHNLYKSNTNILKQMTIIHFLKPTFSTLSVCHLPVHNHMIRASTIHPSAGEPSKIDCGFPLCRVTASHRTRHMLHRSACPWGRRAHKTMPHKYHPPPHPQIDYRQYLSGSVGG